MVQWTTPFMIGITNDGLNSDIVGQCFLSATNRLTYIIPQSTLILKQTIHNFSKSPSKSCSG